MKLVKLMKEVLKNDLKLRKNSIKMNKKYKKFNKNHETVKITLKSPAKDAKQMIKITKNCGEF